MNEWRKILRILPDKLYLQIQSFYKIKRFINFRNPKTFNEKLQWLKIYDRKPHYTILVDKYLVKNVISKNIGQKYVIPTLGVWTDVDDIDINSLPNRFVLKANHDSGSIVICRDKSKFDWEKEKLSLKKCLNNNFYWYGREWPYKNVKPCIIAEMYLEDESLKNDNTQPIGLTDYKFFCFDGIPKFIYISKGLENHETARISFYDMNGKEMPFHRSDFKPLGTIDFPENFNEMKKLAQKIACLTKSSFSRIDLYSINNKIYFSEITFQPGSGLLPFTPKKWDYKIGKLIKLPK